MQLYICMWVDWIPGKPWNWENPSLSLVAVIQVANPHTGASVTVNGDRGSPTIHRWFQSSSLACRRAHLLRWSSPCECSPTSSSSLACTNAPCPPSTGAHPDPPTEQVSGLHEELPPTECTLLSGCYQPTQTQSGLTGTTTSKWDRNIKHSPCLSPSSCR